MQQNDFFDFIEPWWTFGVSEQTEARVIRQNGKCSVVVSQDTEQTNCSSSTCSNIDTSNELCISHIENTPSVNCKPNRQGKRWDSYEEEKLSELYKSEGVDAIATILGRSPFAVVCRLIHLGLISNVESIKGFSGNIPTCERTIGVKGANEEIVLPSFEKREKAVKECIPKVHRERTNKKPSFRVMITRALTAICGPYERGGWGSLSFIKKYLETNYNVNPKNKWIMKTVANMLKAGELRCPQGRKVYSLTRMKLPEPVWLEKKYDSDEESNDFDEEIIFDVTKSDFEKVMVGIHSNKFAMTDTPKKIAAIIGIAEAIVCQIVKKFVFLLKKWPSIDENAKTVTKKEYDSSIDSEESELSNDDSYEECMEGFIADTIGGGKSYVPFHTLYPKMMIEIDLKSPLSGVKSCESDNI